MNKTEVFKQFLKDNNCFDSFVNNVSKNYVMEKFWPHIETDDYDMFFLGFNWNDSPEGPHYWKCIYDKWIEFNERNNGKDEKE